MADAPWMVEIHLTLSVPLYLDRTSTATGPATPPATRPDAGFPFTAALPLVAKASPRRSRSPRSREGDANAGKGRQGDTVSVHLACCGKGGADGISVEDCGKGRKGGKGDADCISTEDVGKGGKGDKGDTGGISIEDVGKGGEGGKGEAAGSSLQSVAKGDGTGGKGDTAGISMEDVGKGGADDLGNSGGSSKGSKCYRQVGTVSGKGKEGKYAMDVTIWPGKGPSGADVRREEREGVVSSACGGDHPETQCS